VTALLEAIPNVSEGRRREVVDRLAAAAAGAAGVTLLDRCSDPDHHRSVLTLAGSAPDLIAALLALYEVAVAEIDLTRQRGVHPRVGAVDVVPFVPLFSGRASGATPSERAFGAAVSERAFGATVSERAFGATGAPMAAAVAAARVLGEEVAARFGIPVYLYEEAATRPERRRLADIRRGGFEGFAARIATPGWEPDFGPRRVHPTAGVSVIGARWFLIAFNAVLDTADPAIAREVARAVRESSGGLPAVRAIGVPLASRGLAQVSMNLLDYRRTSIADALAAVEAEAARRGARVVDTEVVGLVPEAAVCGTLGADRVLERRLPPAS
jgi:glutamate formiminotransferase